MTQTTGKTTLAIPKIIVWRPSAISLEPPFSDPTYVHYTMHLIQAWLPHSQSNSLLVPPKKRHVLSRRAIRRLRRGDKVDVQLLWLVHDTAYFEQALKLLPAEEIMDGNMKPETLEALFEKHDLTTEEFWTNVCDQIVRMRKTMQACVTR
jgi:hypothetical protein